MKAYLIKTGKEVNIKPVFDQALRCLIGVVDIDTGVAYNDTDLDYNTEEFDDMARDEIHKLRAQRIEEQEKLRIKQLPPAHPSVDWEVRRYEISKSILSAIVSTNKEFDKYIQQAPRLRLPKDEVKNTVAYALLYTDVLIEELKKAGHE